MDSQCRPRLLMRTSSRCSGVACNRQGNHASGTPRTRPSLSETHMLSLSKRTVLAELVSKEVIPSSLNTVSVCFHYSQLARGREATCEGYRRSAATPEYMKIAQIPDTPTQVQRIGRFGGSFLAYPTHVIARTTKPTKRSNPGPL